MKNIMSKIKNIINHFDKRILISGSLGILGLSLIIVALFIPKNKFKNIDIIFDQTTPIMVKNNSKYLFIDTNGKEITKQRYTYAKNFNGDYAITEQEKNDISTYSIIDRKGNVVRSKIGSIKYIGDHGVWIIDNNIYDSNLKPIFSDDDTLIDYLGSGYFSYKNYRKNISGILDYTGKKTYEVKSTSVDYDDDSLNNYDDDDDEIENKNKYCSIKDGKYSYIINCKTGKIILKPTKDIDIDYYKNNIFKINERKSYQFIKKICIFNDKIIYETEDDKIDIYYHYDKYLRVSDAKANDTYYDLKTGKIADEDKAIEEAKKIDNLPTKIDEFTKVSCSGNYGLMKKNKMIIPCKYGDISIFKEPLNTYLKAKNKNYIIATTDDKTQLINLKNQKVVKEFNTTRLVDKYEGPFVYYYQNDDVVVYNILTKKEIKIKDATVNQVGSNYISTITTSGKLNYYNSNLKLIYSTKESDKLY